jgi:diguanylate cyclase (GGDEF)-like protein
VTCALCGESGVRAHDSPDRDAHRYRVTCDRCGTFDVDDMAWSLYENQHTPGWTQNRYLLSGRARNATIEGRTWVTPEQSKDYPVAYCKNGSDWATLLWDVHAEQWIQDEGGLQFRINLAGRRQLQLLSKTVTTQTKEHGDYWSTYAEADLDALTKLIGRGRFNIDLERSFADSSEISPVALLFVDIDHFKKINDEHGGHAEGDRVLGRVAAILRSAVGRRGLVYRYGGEEITVILPGFSGSEAAAVAERLRESVERVDWCLVPPRSVTVSIGVACVPDGKISSPALFCQHADQAMYSAKTNGRNRVALARAVD